MVGQGAGTRRRRAALLAVGVVALGGASAASAQAAVTLTQPATGTATKDATPTFAGTAGTDPALVEEEVVIRIWQGDPPLVVREFEILVSPDDGTFSGADTQPLPPGEYFASAGQGLNGGGVDESTPPVAFTIVESVPPVVTLADPVDGTDATPTLTGTAGTAPGDEEEVLVEVWAGSATGTPLHSLTVPVGGAGAFAATTPPLEPGTYVARATQRDSADNEGASEDVTFVVEEAPPAGSGGGGGGAGGGGGGGGGGGTPGTPGTATPGAGGDASAGPGGTATPGQPGTTTGDEPSTAPQPRGIRRALATLLGAAGRQARITALLEDGATRVRFSAPVAGTVALRFVARTRGARTVIAKGRRTAGQAGPVVVRIRLTKRGRRLVEHLDGGRLRIAVAASLTPDDGAPVRRRTRLTVRP